MKKKKEKKHSIFKYLALLIIFLTIVAIYSYYIETKRIIVKEYSIINKKIPNKFDGTKIVHFSDLHFGTSIKENELEKIKTKMNTLNPELVIFTGDLVDDGYQITEEQKNKLINFLNEINAKIGKYIIRGNHDLTDIYDSIITKTDFIELNNINKNIFKEDSKIKIIGLDDYLEGNQNIENAFDFESEDLYTILITHEPDTIDKIKDYNIDLMLSGHSHNGQIRIPFIGAVYTPIGSKKYYDERYLIDETSLYISSGLGTTVIPFRLFNKPSFNLYRLYTK